MKGRRSKLELYVDTIEALASSGPMPLARLTLRTKINNNPLKAIMCDLLDKKLVEEREVKKRIFYAATPKARTVLSYFNQLTQILPLA
jgi:predicted transcriptional regulator